MADFEKKLGPNRKDRTEQIKKVAKRLFRKKGYENVTMREIAKELGIGVNVIYRNTESKSAVLADILRDHIRAEILTLSNLPTPKGSAVDRVMAYLEKLYEMDLKDFDLRRLGVALSWRWERERDYEFEVLIGVELFAPIYGALYQLGLNIKRTSSSMRSTLVKLSVAISFMHAIVCVLNNPRPSWPIILGAR